MIPPPRQSCRDSYAGLLMSVCWRKLAKMWKRLLIVVALGLAWLWLLSRYWTGADHMEVGRLLSLHVDDHDVIQLRLRSTDGSMRLRGTLGSVEGTGDLKDVSDLFVAGDLKSCSAADSSDCVELKVGPRYKEKPALRLEVASTGEDCYTVSWRPDGPASKRDVSVTDCYALDKALWYAAPLVLHQRWPSNTQTSAMQPHTTGDYLSSQWRADRAYGKYGSLAEPYWLSSLGVGIIVDEHISLSSSFNDAGNARLCLKGDRATTVKTESDDLGEMLLSYTICHGEDIVAVHKTMSARFFARPTGYPDLRMMREPIWSTWAQYKSAVKQSSVQEMAERILHYKFPHSQLEIDDRYTTTYGQFDFDIKKFPNASGMMRSLHARGFRVTSWITPFSNVECPATAEGKAKKFWLLDNSSSRTLTPAPAFTRWWRGRGAVLDVTNSDAVTWFTQRLRQFSQQFGIDSFKFDAGEVSYLPKRFRSAKPLDNINYYTTLYVNMAASFNRMIEVRGGFRSQQLPVFVRMLDKDSAWGRDNGLRSIIPTALTFGISGYPFVLPDMIGGNGIMDDLDQGTGGGKGGLPERELYVRWTELAAFLPAMQFSLAPWQYDNVTVDIARKYARLHQTAVGDMIEAAAKDAVLHGWPIIRPLWWLAPTDDVALRCDSQFLLGDRLLVAPVLHQGAQSRDVYLPGAPSIRWKDYFASEPSVAERLSGGTWIRNKSVQLDEIAVFVRDD